MTDQPYAFVNDDPLNCEDPWGLYAALGNGGSAFVSQTKSKSGEKKTTVIVTSGSSKPVKVSVSTSVVKVPVGMGFTLSISASASVSHAASKSTPSLDVGSDGSVSLESNGVSVSALNGEPTTTMMGSIDVPGGSSTQSFQVGGDQVSTSISASLSYQPQSNSYFSVSNGLLWDGVAATTAYGVIDWFVTTFGKLAPEAG
jgi:hypothetical protein